MASGNKSVAVTNWDTLKFSWWENSQSAANNSTEVGWKLELIAGSDGRIGTTNTREWNVTVAGKSYSGMVSVDIGNNETKTLANNTTTVTHDTNGEKTFSYSFSQDFTGISFSGVALGVISGSGTGTLTPITGGSGGSSGGGSNEGVVYIDSGSGWDKYQVYIDNGSGWDRYAPYIDNGSSWEGV